VRIAKRIPMQAGLGGGSSDAAAALRALAKLWRLDLPPARMQRIAAELGADVPFFLQGGTAIGIERGDVVRAQPDAQPSWVVLVLPSFGVHTIAAYRWWDADNRAAVLKGRRVGIRGGREMSRVSAEEVLAISRVRLDGLVTMRLQPGRAARGHQRSRQDVSDRHGEGDGEEHRAKQKTAQARHQSQRQQDEQARDELRPQPAAQAEKEQPESEHWQGSGKRRPRCVQPDRGQPPVLADPGERQRDDEQCDRVCDCAADQ